MGLVLALIAINGFFVAGEFALVAVNRSRVESLADAGDRAATRLLTRLRSLSFQLSGAQLGITVSSLVLGAIAEPTVARLLQPAFGAVGLSSERLALITAFVLATMFQMVLGELFPKNLAIARPYKVAIGVGVPMGAVNGILRPLIVLFNTAANWTVRRLGIEPREELAGLRSMRELEMIVQASSAEGELEEHETSLLTRAIAFGEKDAADAMIPRIAVEGVPATATVAELRERALTTGHSRFPVYEGDLDSVVGIAYVKDTFAIPPDQRPATSVRRIAVPAPVVPETMRLDSLLIELQAAGRTMAWVVDEYGGTAGIVTIEDIVEEILGEIADEYDLAEEAETGDAISGGLHRHEVEELTGFEWPEGSYETLSGYVTAQLDRFPRPGDVVLSGNHRIEVVSVDDRIAERLVVTRLPEAER